MGYIGKHIKIRKRRWPVRFSLDQGGKSAGIRVAMTKQMMGQLEGAGEDPFAHKEAMGGLIGALHMMMTSIHSP